MRDRLEYLLEVLEEEEALVAKEFESALIGYTNGANLVAVYDYELCVHILMEDNMTYEQAIEHMEYNVVGGYMGEKTPIFITPCL